MLLITEIEDAGERLVANLFLEASAQSAKQLAQTFDKSCAVRLGAVRKLPGGAMFEIAGWAGVVPVTIVIKIPVSIPQADVWCAYYDVLEDAGLTVAADASYEAFVRTLSEPFEAAS